MDRMKKLLTLIASGRSIGSAWREAGYSSEAEARGSLSTLAGSIGPERNGKEKEAGSEGSRVKGTIIINADGASRGNPGEASVAAIASLPTGEVLTSRGMRIGRATNNEAEYRALAAGLELAAELGAERVSVKLDSELVVKQMNGEYRIKNPRLSELAEEVRRMASAFRSVSYEHVRRAENREADKLANDVLDGRE